MGIATTTPTSINDHLMTLEEFPMARRTMCPGDALAHTQLIQDDINQAMNAATQKSIDERYGWEFDAITGQKLEPQLASQGRLLEMDSLQK